MQRFLIDYQGFYRIVHKRTGLALQYDKNSPISQFTLNTPNQDSFTQLWMIEREQKYKFKLKNVVLEQYLAEKDNQLILSQNSHLHKRRRMWYLDTSTPDIVRIQNVRTQVYLSSDNYKCYLNKTHFLNADGWQFIKVQNKKLLAQECCNIICNQTNKSLDIPASKVTEGIQLIIWEQHNGFNQKFQLYKAGDVYVIKSLITGLNLDIKSRKNQQGAEVIQWTSHGDANQLWKLQNRGNNVYRISSWMDSSLQLGHNGKKVQMSRGNRFLWRINGYIPK